MFQERVPNMGRTVVFGPAEDAHIDQVATLRQAALPFDAGVGDEHDVDLVFVSQHLEEMCGGGTFPQKLIHLSRTAVAEQHLKRT